MGAYSRIYSIVNPEFSADVTGLKINFIFLLLEKLNILETQIIKLVACGEAFTIVLNADNQLYAFGANDNGQLGYSTKGKKFSEKPRFVKTIQPIFSGIGLWEYSRPCLKSYYAAAYSHF